MILGFYDIVIIVGLVCIVSAILANRRADMMQREIERLASVVEDCKDRLDTISSELETVSRTTDDLAKWAADGTPPGHFESHPESLGPMYIKDKDYS